LHPMDPQVLVELPHCGYSVFTRIMAHLFDFGLPQSVLLL